jgi:5-methylcytosine-specific restriction endonuclease McrBC regulatory subunit McrC
MLSEAAGSSRSCSFLVDMNQLYESFLEEGLRRRLASANVRVLGHEERHLDLENRLVIRPDIVLRHGATTTFVLDAKYILASLGMAHADHHYQLLSYAIRHDVRDVALVYVPSGLASPLELVATIRNAGVRITPGRWT